MINLKKVLAIFLIIINIFIIAALSYSAIAANKEKNLYKVGFWPHQYIKKIDEFKITHDDYTGFLFGHHFDIYGEIKSTLFSIDGYRPYIKGLHVSEQLIGKPGEKKVYVDITPIIDLKIDKKCEFSDIPYTYTFKHQLNSYQWGKNTYVIRCMGIEQIIEMDNQK